MLRRPIAHPSALPHVDDYTGRLSLEMSTHDRALPHVDAVALEQRSQRLMHYFGCKQLQGSQHGKKMYYTELLTHEMAHALLLGLPWKRRLDKRVYEEVRSLPKTLSDVNELEAAASTMLVLEYLGLPYDIWALALSTSQNLRCGLRLATQMFPHLMVRREEPRLQEVARQIVCRLLKLKYEKVREFKHL